MMHFLLQFREIILNGIPTTCLCQIRGFIRIVCHFEYFYCIKVGDLDNGVVQLHVFSPDSSLIMGQLLCV